MSWGPAKETTISFSSTFGSDSASIVIRRLVAALFLPRLDAQPAPKAAFLYSDLDELALSPSGTAAVHARSIEPMASDMLHK